MNTYINKKYIRYITLYTYVHTCTHTINVLHTYIYTYVRTSHSRQSFVDPNSLISQVAKEHGTLFFECSAKEGTNVEAAFMSLARTIKSKLAAVGPSLVQSACHDYLITKS